MKAGEVAGQLLWLKWLLSIMPLIPRRPFFDLEKFFSDDNFFPSESSFALREPRMNVYEEDDDLIVKVELPGVEPENVDVKITEDALKIQAKHERKEEKEEKGYYKKELSRGFFKRAIPLPVKVDDQQAEAHYEDGVLTITASKIEQQIEEEQGTDVEVKEG